jgi:hypothetical protein
MPPRCLKHQLATVPVAFYFSANSPPIPPSHQHQPPFPLPKMVPSTSLAPSCATSWHPPWKPNSEHFSTMHETAYHSAPLSSKWATIRKQRRCRQTMRVTLASPTKLLNNADQKPSTCISIGYAITSNKANSSYIGAKAPTISPPTLQNIIPLPITNTFTLITYLKCTNQHPLSYTNQYNSICIRGCVDEHICTHARAHMYSSH